MFLISFAIVLAAIMIVPLASADDGNVTAVTTPFITINPIGNHTLDEVFFISGTTNLPASGSPLLLQIGSNWYNPGGSGCGCQSNVTIEPGRTGSIPGRAMQRRVSGRHTGLSRGLWSPTVPSRGGTW